MTSSSDVGLTITRVFDAPRELVFKAWTEPERFAQWWGPNGFTTPACTIDLRPGGKLHFCMRSPEGDDIWCGGEFREITPPSRLVWDDYFADEQGNRVSPSKYGLSPDFPEVQVITLTFEEQEGKTRMTMHQSVPSHLPEFEGAQQGWSESFDRLDAYLRRA